MLKILICILFSLQLFSQNTFFYQNGKKVFLERLKRNTIRALNNGNIIYYKSANYILGINDEIIIKTHNKIENILYKYKVKLKKQITPLIYVLIVSDNTKTISISNNMYNDKDIEYSHPNFIKNKKLR